MMRRFIRLSIASLLIAIGIVFASVWLYLGFLAITRYTPPPVQVTFKSTARERKKETPNRTWKILSWNIGYAGLDATMDFFFDGGKNLRTSAEQASKNLKGITHFLQTKADEMDVMFLQEVDKNSWRSHCFDQFQYIKKAIPTHDSVQFIKNFDVKYVVLLDRLLFFGKIKSGMVSFSQNSPKETTRHQYSSKLNFPFYLVGPASCFEVLRYEVGEKELVVIQLHNDAYGDIALHICQIRQLFHFLVQEYKKGNYVVAGGDWNAVPSQYKTSSEERESGMFKEYEITSEWDRLKDWFIVYDKKIPTNRSLKRSFKSSKSHVSVLDFFVVSPNLKVVASKTYDLNFVHSDHNPISIEVKPLTESAK